MQDLTNKILLLHPNAAFGIRGSFLSEQHRSEFREPIHERSGMFVLWNDENEMPCPSQEQLDAIDMADVAVDVERKRKDDRDKVFEKDLVMKAVFKIEKRLNPSLKFSEYLDELEAEEV